MRDYLFHLYYHSRKIERQVECGFGMRFNGKTFDAVKENITSQEKYPRANFRGNFGSCQRFEESSLVCIKRLNNPASFSRKSIARLRYYSSVLFSSFPDES